MATFCVDGIPKAQPRPRAFAMRFGAKSSARMYDPGTADGWKARVALAAQPHCPATPVEGPVRLVLLLFLPRPKNRCRKSDPPGPIWCITKPDAENAAKPVMDCLTNIGWWRDDSQVVELIVTKQYHAIGGRPGALITIEELTPAKEPASEPHTGARRTDTPAMTRGLRRPRSNGEVLGPAAASSFTPPALGVAPSED